MAASSGLDGKGFFASLFDFKFESFITLRFLRVIYVLLLIAWALGTVILFFASLIGGLSSDNGAVGGVLVAIFVVPVVSFLYLLGIRVYLELIALFFRIGDSVALLQQKLAPEAVGYTPPSWTPPAQPQGPQGPPSGYPQGPSQGPPQGPPQEGPPPGNPWGQEPPK